MTITLEQPRYVRLGTRNLKEATHFATEILGLEHVGTAGGRAYFRSDYRDHTLCFVEGDPRAHSLALDVRTAEALEAAESDLRGAGFAPRRGTADECAERRVKAFIAFPDASGNMLEIVWRPLMSGWRYFPHRDAGITGFRGVALRTTDPEADQALWTKVFNGRISDWVGDAAYIRLDSLHHRIALHPADRPGILTVMFEVESINQVMQSQHYLLARQVKIVHGPGRQPTSGQIFLMFEGPDGVLYSYVTGGDAIAEEATHLPRQFPDVPSSFCSWGSECMLSEFGGRGVGRQDWTK